MFGRSGLAFNAFIPFVPVYQSVVGAPRDSTLPFGAPVRKGGNDGTYTPTNETSTSNQPV